jgi:tRNA threonylcarbamoyladenosine biosynthesis protein TsaB
MLVLTIETCTDTSTLGLVRDGAVLMEMAFPSRHTLAQRLLTRLEWMLAECGVTKADLEAIALSLGPGSFTGVRIGAAAAKTLAQWLHIPLVGVSTLEALAYPFREVAHTLLVPVINARRQQVYLALFQSEGGRLRRRTSDLLLSAEPFSALLQEQRADFSSILLIGQVTGLPAPFRTEAGVPLAAVQGLVTPQALAALGMERLERGEVDDPMTLTPIYLRSAAD